MAISKTVAFCVLLLHSGGDLVCGHGNMVRPMAWYDEGHLGWEWDEGEGDSIDILGTSRNLSQMAS